MFNLSKIKAKHVKRSPVMVNSEAEAAAIKRRWATEDAIRLLDARLNHINAHLSSGVRKVSAEAVCEAAAEAVSAARQAANEHARAEAQRQRAEEKRRRIAQAKRDAARAARKKRYDEEREKAMATFEQDYDDIRAVFVDSRAANRAQCDNEYTEISRILREKFRFSSEGHKWANAENAATFERYAARKKEIEETYENSKKEARARYSDKLKKLSDLYS